MHILFLTQVLPYPLDAGPKVRAYYTLRHLAQQHKVTLVSFVRAGDSSEAVDHLRTVCDAVYLVDMTRSRIKDGWHLVRSLLSETPFLIARDRVPAMYTQLRMLMQRDRSFDVIHADQLWMAPYALQARQLCTHSRAPTTVLDQHNAVFQIPRRLAQYDVNPIKRVLLNVEAQKLARYERRVCQEFDHVVWVTDEDRVALTAQTENGTAQAVMRNTTVIPICVDTVQQPVIRRRPDAARVTFLGGLHWPPNAEGILWFAREVWPRVLRDVPDARLTVIGKDPPDALSVDGAIDVTGYVSDPTPYLAETGVFIVPLHAGGGMRVKILDAWCWGLPVVSTTVGAEGVCVEEGENILLADRPDVFAHAVVQTLRDGDLAERLATGGRRTVEQEYDWRRVYRAWDCVYRGL